MSPGPRLVLVGGGHSHVEVLRRLAMPDSVRCNVTLVARETLAPYSGMLPGFIAGHYSHAECHIDVRQLARSAGARVCHAAVTGIDLAANIVHCAGRPDIGFDVLSLNVGSRPAIDDVPGAQEWAWPAKPVDALIARWEQLLVDLDRAPKTHHIVIVGGGAGGVELALSMRHRLSGASPPLLKLVRIDLVNAEPVLLSTHAPGVQRRMARALARAGIAVHVGERATEVLAGSVHCESGLTLPFDTLIWTTHAAPLDWLRTSGLTTDDDGFIAVNESLQSVSHAYVFASGDAASLRHAPRPKSGVFAVREGPRLAENLCRILANQPLRPYWPQRKHLALIGTGRRSAVASWGPISAEGAWVWRCKEGIDRNWIGKYQQMRMRARANSFPTAGRNAPNAAPDMPCAGCGAKLGHDVLHRALARLESARRPDVLIGLDSPDDAAVVEPPRGMLSVHTVDVFPALVADPYVAGQIGAVHCLSDIYAMGALPRTALAIVTLPEAHAGVQEDTLADVLAGALSVLMPEHTALIGGHTLQGDRLEFGLSVNGAISRERLLNARSPQPGDRLILTKPLGIGSIFAADMRRDSRSRWVAEATALMTQSNAAAARILYDNSASACTDVTGFGLAGHLITLLHKHAMSAELECEKIPALEGARSATRAGFRSSLFPENRVVQRDIDSERAGGDVYPLLFDPQTAGGLLAAIPSDRARACLAELRSAGYVDAAEIGSLAGALAGARIRLV